VACAAAASAGWAGIAIATTNAMAVVLGCCALAGAFQPPLASCMRALWPVLVREPEGCEAAYALESTSQELLYITGPLLLAGVVGVASPRVAAAAWAALGLAGTVLFAASPPSRAWSAWGPGPRRHWAGALADAGIRWLLAIKVVWMVAVGMLLVALAATAFPLALARSTAELALLFSVFGIGLAPWLASADALTQTVAPPGTLTEAFTWGDRGRAAGPGARRQPGWRAAGHRVAGHGVPGRRHAAGARDRRRRRGRQADPQRPAR
jgi:hypothetical protein